VNPSVSHGRYVLFSFHSRAGFYALAICAGVMRPAISSRFPTATAFFTSRVKLAAARCTTCMSHIFLLHAMSEFLEPAEVMLRTYVLLRNSVLTPLRAGAKSWRDTFFEATHPLILYCAFASSCSANGPHLRRAVA
jgi:hypothetical protein